MSALLGTAFFVLGAICGSFLGLTAERAYTGQSWKTGRSRCNSCCAYLSAPDLIPILSWVFTRGRCRHCGSKVPFLYALYELALGILFLGGYLAFGLSLPLAIYLLALLPLGFLVIYDLRHTLVPQEASALFILLALLFALVRAPSMHALFLTFAYAFGIALFFFCLYAITRGRAMGLGDTPLSFGFALLAGLRSIDGLFFSFWIGGVIGILILAFRKGGPRMGIEVPFAPFMAAGFLLALLTQWNPLPF